MNKRNVDVDVDVKGDQDTVGDNQLSFKLFQ